MPEKPKKHGAHEKRISPAQIVKSVLSAAFGVQKNKNRMRDFSHGKPLHYIVVGVLFVVAFIGLLMFLVRTITGGSSG
jgi:hypothetical protein